MVNDRTLDMIRKLAVRQNCSLEFYGRRSNEYETSRVVLNQTLDTLQSADLINTYGFAYRNIDSLGYIEYITLFTDDDVILVKVWHK